jgi:hypothetical protein
MLAFDRDLAIHHGRVKVTNQFGEGFAKRILAMGLPTPVR